MSPNDGMTRKFIVSNGGLFCHDLWDDELYFNDKNLVFMNVQKENSEWHTKMQFARSKKQEIHIR